MSDLDKAIRAAADEANWFGQHHALTAVLDELNGWDRDVPVFADRLRRVIAESMGVSGEGRSEPTPAPREPRVWRHRGTDYEPDPGDGVRVRDCHGDIWTARDRGPGDRVWETPDTAPFRWDYVLKKWGPLTEVLSEVVSPEGTP